MRWDDFRQSENVEDYRGSGGGGGYGGGIGIPGGAGGLGIGTVIILGLVGWALGIDPRLLIGGAEIVMGGRPAQHESPGRTGPSRTAPPTDELGRFVAKVLGETEDRWKEIFQQVGRQYNAPKLTLFAGSIRAGACGQAQSAMGPFYCPPDRRIYLDTSFFRDLQTRFRGCQAGSKSCEFAHAYVIAHEVGHHVQNLLGILPKVQSAQRAVDRRQANQMQVRVELQADCFAGVWAHHTEQRRRFLEPGDIEAALQTAAAIGDDRLQRRSQGHVVPDSFTHGSSEQRQRWFTIGFRQGKIESCDTFNTSQL